MIFDKEMREKCPVLHAYFTGKGYYGQIPTPDISLSNAGNLKLCGNSGQMIVAYPAAIPAEGRDELREIFPGKTLNMKPSKEKNAEKKGVINARKQFAKAVVQQNCKEIGEKVAELFQGKYGAVPEVQYQPHQFDVRFGRVSKPFSYKDAALLNCIKCNQELDIIAIAQFVYNGLVREIQSRAEQKSRENLEAAIKQEAKRIRKELEGYVVDKKSGTTIWFNGNNLILKSSFNGDPVVCHPKAEFRADNYVMYEQAEELDKWGAYHYNAFCDMDKVRKAFEKKSRSVFEKSTFEFEKNMVEAKYAAPLVSDIEKCNQYADPLINGRYMLPLKAQVNVDPIQNRAIASVPGYIEYTYAPGKNPKKIYSEEYKTIVALNAKVRYQGCIEFAKKLIKEYSFDMYRVSGDLMSGQCSVRVKPEALSITKYYSLRTAAESLQEFKLDVPPWNESATAWKKNLSNFFKSIRKGIDAYKQAQKEAFEKQYRWYYDEWIYRDIYEFIQTNERYVTENAAIQYLRGLKIQFSGSITDTGSYRRYNDMSSKAVEQKIDRLIRCRVLYEKKLKGTYGDFYILRTNEEIPNIALSTGTPAACRKKLRKGDAMSDTERDAVLNDICAKETVDMKDYVDIISMSADGPSFFCNRKDKIRELLETAPDDIFDILKMKKEMEQDDYKLKLYGSLLKIAKERKKKAG